MKIKADRTMWYENGAFAGELMGERPHVHYIAKGWMPDFAVYANGKKYPLGFSYMRDVRKYFRGTQGDENFKKIVDGTY